MMRVLAMSCVVLSLAAGWPGRAVAAPPAPTITSGPTSPTNQTSASFTFSESDPGATLVCKLDDAVFTACDSSTGQDYSGPLDAGGHVFSLRAQDDSGESDVVSFSWTIDPRPPQITLSGVPVDRSNTQSASFSFFADEPNSFTCQIDGQGIEPCQPDPSEPGNAAKGTMAYSGLAEGAHAFTVTATDAGGNFASRVFNWTIDLTTPTLSITSTPLDPTPSNAANFRFQSGEASTFGCQLDAATPGAHGPCDPDPDDIDNPAKGAKSYTGLSEGAYTFTVTATDGAGNPSTQTFSWVIDAQAPSVAFDTPSPGPNAHGWNNTDVSISFTIQDTGAGVDAGRSTPSPLVLSAEGAAVTGTVMATDNAGNTASIPSPAVKIDKTAPTVSITAPADGAVFPLGLSFAAAYSCADSLSGADICDGPVPSGGNIDTASLGGRTFTVNATDRAGNPASRTASYSVIPAVPDLVETAVSNPPSIALPGSSFSATDTVLNQGGATAPASTTRYYLSLDTVKDGGDLLLPGIRSVPSLAWGVSSSGLSVTLTIPATIPLRKYYLLACADDTAVVTETNESNNCRASAATVQVTRPDLVQTAVSDPPAAGTPGSTFKVVDTVKNQGLVAAAASKTQYYLSIDQLKGSADTPLAGSRSVPSLAPGAESGGKSITVTIPSAMPLGAYYLLACADDTALVNETEEANNCGSSAMPIQVTGSDLVQTAVLNPPSAAAPGSSIKLTDTVQNQGLVAAAASKTRYYLSADQQKDSGDTLLTGSRSVPSLGPGASSAGATMTVTVPSTIPLGAYYLLACADDTGVVPETDEHNNCRASVTPVQVTRPDLVPTAVSNPPAVAARRSGFKVADTVQNQGLVAATASTTRYYLSASQQKSSGDTLLTGSRSVPVLAPGTGFTGSTLTVTIPSTIPVGLYYLLACADDIGLVTEMDETNNCRASASRVSVTP
jgi:subtilase family serine protease